MKKGLEGKKYSNLIALSLSVFLLLIGYTGAGVLIKNSFSYIFDPIHLVASNSGKSISNWGQALIDASSYIEEYNSMKEEIARLKADSTERVIDYQEYETLKQHISLISSDSKYVESSIVKISNQGEILLNKGEKGGIKKGDTVSFGRVFLGTIIDVSSNSSLVRLPTNNASTYEVVVVPSSVNLNEKFTVDSFVKSKGVVSGDLEGIRIENMGINSDVSDGDLVLIRDERVKELLILGSLVGVSKNPASTHKNGFVSPIFDYSNILTVFVRIGEKND